ncbi:hypothetical protein ACWD0E_24390 [Streptomyces sp. NPDC003002]
MAVSARTRRAGPDSAGYLIGREGGTPLLNHLTCRFPRHFSAGNIAAATGSFHGREAAVTP